MMLVDEFGGEDQPILNHTDFVRKRKTSDNREGRKDWHKNQPRISPESEKSRRRHNLGIFRRSKSNKPNEEHEALISHRKVMNSKGRSILKVNAKFIEEDKWKAKGKGRPLKTNVEVQNEEDDVIVIDDDEDAPLKSRSWRVPESSVGPKELCVYHRQAITEHDYKTLEDEQYLNDAIINFYLTYLYENLPEKEKKVVHIYSSHFYSRLKGSGAKKSKSSPNQSQAERCYERVKSWTKKIDIFSKRMLIFPICEEEHWYLIFVCNPGLVLSQKRNQNFEKAREKQQKSEGQGSNPFLMILDSLDGTHSTALSKIRSYLQLEYLEKKCKPLTFGKDKMNEKHPAIPLQPNSCDCGLFLLHYVQLIFDDIYKFLGAQLPDLRKWFTEKEIDYKRHDIAHIIRGLAGKAVKFPKIKFPAKRPLVDPHLRSNSRGVVNERRRPQTPPYPPPPSDSEDDRPSSPPAAKKPRSLVRDCSVVTKKLEKIKGSNKKFFKHSSRGNSSSDSVIKSKSEMFKELMKSCK